MDEKTPDISAENSEKYILHVGTYEGPLDLLWDLIKRSQIDIAEISISQITEQYIAYLKLMEQMNIQIATEFIVMASELLYYKSRLLLPSEEIDDEFFVPPLPPELVAKLLEYKKYQIASAELRNRYDVQSNCYVRAENELPFAEETEYTTVSLFDLLNAFVEVLGSQKKIEEKEIIFDEILVSDRIEFIMKLLEGKEKITFREIFPKIPSKAEVIASFLAILEMTKIKSVRLLQERVFSEIFIFKKDPASVPEPSAAQNV